MSSKFKLTQNSEMPTQVGLNPEAIPAVMEALQDVIKALSPVENPVPADEDGETITLATSTVHHALNHARAALAALKS